MSIRAAEAIGQFESGGNYQAIGPVTAKGNKAYGKYQIMDFNIPSWSKQALGTSISTKEFLNDPKKQDKIARFKISEYYKKYKNVADVASVWFSGRPVQAAGEAKDVLGTSVPQYVKNVEAIYNRTENPMLKNFNTKVDKSRQSGLTDTDILNKLAERDPELEEKIQKSRTQLGLNDRDLLNKLSVKFSGEMPTVASVPLVKEEIKRGALGEIKEEKPEPERLKETGKGIWASIKRRGEKVGEALIAMDIPFTKKDDKIREQLGITEQTPVETALQMGAESVLTIGDSLFEVVKGLAKKADDISKGKLSEALEPGAKEFIEDIKEIYKTAPTGLLSNIRQDNPELADKLEQKANEIKNRLETDDRLRRNLAIPAAALEAIGWKATKPAREGLTTLAEATKETAERTAKTSLVGLGEAKKVLGKVGEEVIAPIEKGFSIIRKKVEEVKGKRPFGVVKEKIIAKEKTLEDIVSPKLGKGEKIKAITEKRIKTGADFPGLGKAPDIIAPSKSVKRISDTLRKYIPNAETLDKFEIVNEADKIITNLSKEIRPTLKTLDFTPSKRKSLFDNWNKLKKEQNKSIFFGTAPVKKFQQATDEFFEQVNKKVKGSDGKFRSWNMEDLWDFRIAYDNLKDVKRIKKLLDKIDLSGEEQLLIDMWRENRDLLNQFIKNSAKEIGEDVGSKWLDMSDMFEVINNISLKADIDLIGEPDILRKFITIPTKIIR